jgi:hypothetical protein
VFARKRETERPGDIISNQEASIMEIKINKEVLFPWKPALSDELALGFWGGF